MRLESCRFLPLKECSPKYNYSCSYNKEILRGR